MPVRKEIRHAAVILAFFAVLTAIGLIGRDAGWTEVFLVLAIGTLMLLWAVQVSRAPRRRMLPLLGKNWAAASGEIIPRPDATPEQLKRLGAALAEWWERRGGGTEGGPHWIDGAALNDLLAGELPQPFVLRILTEMHNSPSSPGTAALGLPGRMTTRELREALHEARDTHPHLARSIPQADSRTVPFGLGSAGQIDRQTIIAGLRRFVATELVEDILIDGQSWELLD
jgi:hypothetical protein